MADDELYSKAFEIQQRCCMEYDEEMIDHIYKQLKSCPYIVPPAAGIPRWHCDMGDGREGDCLILMGKPLPCKIREDAIIESAGRQMDEDRKHSHNPLWVWKRFHKPPR
jgi:hypothetical protein